MDPTERANARKSMFIDFIGALLASCRNYLNNRKFDWLLLRKLYLGCNSLKRIVEEMFCETPLKSVLYHEEEFLLLGTWSAPTTEPAGNELFLFRELDILYEFYIGHFWYCYLLMLKAAYPEENEGFISQTRNLVEEIQGFLETYVLRAPELLAAHLGQQVVGQDLGQQVVGLDLGQQVIGQGTGQQVVDQDVFDYRYFQSD